ncbi:MAG: glycosyltransferase family 61 protein [Alphaproteobacteria bacterium]
MDTSIKDTVRGIAESRGHHAILDIGALLDAEQAWEMYAPGELLCVGPNLRYYVGKILTFCEAYGGDRILRASGIGSPTMNSISTQPFGRKSFEAPAMWHRANNVTILFSYAWKDSITLHFTENNDLLRLDTSWISNPAGCTQYIPTSPYPYVARGQKYAIVAIPDNIPKCPDSLVVMPHVENFGHFVLDLLPSYLALSRTQEINGWPVVTHRLNDWQREMLEFFDVDTSRLHVIDPGPERYSRAISFMDAVVPALLPVPYELESVRAALRQKGYPAARGRRRFFLPRRAAPHVATRLVNQDDISEVLAGIGFETVYPEEVSFEERVKMFSEADLIVSPTGASTGNQIFAPERATLVELMGEAWDLGNADNLTGATKRISACLGQGYYRMTCPMHPQTEEPIRVGMDAPFVCDIDRLKRLLAWIDGA